MIELAITFIDMIMINDVNTVNVIIVVVLSTIIQSNARHLNRASINPIKSNCKVHLSAINSIDCISYYTRRLNSFAVSHAESNSGKWRAKYKWRAKRVNRSISIISNRVKRNFEKLQSKISLWFFHATRRSYMFIARLPTLWKHED